MIVIIIMIWFASSGVRGSEKPTGGGISLGGVKGALVERCVAFGNGAANDGDGTVA